MIVRPFLATLCTFFLCIGTTALSANNEWKVPNLVHSEDSVPSMFQDLVETLPWMQQVGYDADEAYLYRIHNDAYYHLVAFSDNGDIVQLQDASKWSVHPSQRNTVLYWVQSDDIFIKPRSSCFSFYKYVLYNRTTKQAVEVNLFNPPLPMGAYTFRIEHIDPYARLVHLSDNTVWQIDGSDSNFSYWQIGQRVLIGLNNHWRNAKLPHILINVDMYKEPYSAADFYGYGASY